MEREDTFPVRKDITVLPPEDDPKKLKLGWVMYEVESENHFINIMREKLPPEKFQAWMHAKDPARGAETDMADTYREAETKAFEWDKPTSETRVEVLPFLNGLPWNNFALNWVQSLRPSDIRVIGRRGETLEGGQSLWRVYVYLKEDERTIWKIMQRVKIGTYGADDGGDVRGQLHHWQEHGSIEGYVQHRGPLGVINQYALARIKVE